MRLIPDSMDLSAYMRSEDDDAVLVKKAAAFTEQLIAEFRPRSPEDEKHKPAMFSTKLGRVLEFRPGEVTVWAGYNGHRKSMFSGQVALDLCVQRGQRVLIASFEMTPAKTLARMVRQAFAGQPLEHDLASFARWTDGRLWMFDHFGRLSPERCLAVCRYFAQELKGTQVFIDSMMMVVASEEHFDEQKQFATDLVRLAVETGLHVHLVAHCRKPQSAGEEKPPSKYDLRGSAAISDQAHNVVTVWLNKQKKALAEAGEPVGSNDPDALVTVEKQRNGTYEGRAKLWFHEPSLRFTDDAIAPVEPYAFTGGIE